VKLELIFVQTRSGKLIILLVLISLVSTSISPSSSLEEESEISSFSSLLPEYLSLSLSSLLSFLSTSSIV